MASRSAKRAVKRTLRAVMDNPNASPRDRLLATARYERLAKQRKAPKKAEQVRAVEPPAHQAETANTLTPREKLEALVATETDGLSDAQKEYLASLDMPSRNIEPQALGAKEPQSETE